MLLSDQNRTKESEAHAQGSEKEILAIPFFYSKKNMKLECMLFGSIEFFDVQTVSFTNWCLWG